MNRDFKELAGELSEALGERCIETELLAKHATLRIGGPADIWIEPHDLEELGWIVEAAAEVDAPVTLAGLGSNTLFPDEGIRGVVVRLGGELASWEFDGEPGEEALVRAGAGIANAHLVRGLLREGYVGMEFLSLIPGTFGGSIVMNAGTKEQWLSTILERISIGHLRDGHWVLGQLAAEELAMSYRHTEIEQGTIVTHGWIRVEQGDVDEARERMAFDRERRNRTQPYRLASVGSTFANPPGDHAGRLIEEVGLKGHRLGGARISELHANFFVNEDEATARDFLGLMALARHRVREQFGVELRPEVQFVGFDGWSRLDELESSLQEEV